MQKLNEYYKCDSIPVDIDSALAPIAILHHDPEINDDWFIIANSDYSDSIAISIYEPKYMNDNHISLNKKDKKALMEIFNNGGWDKLKDAFNIGCEELCDSCMECKAYLTRKNNFPSTPPDYTQLPD